MSIYSICVLKPIFRYLSNTGSYTLKKFKYSKEKLKRQKKAGKQKRLKKENK